MKKFLPILALALGACSEAGEKVAGPQFEIVDVDERVDADDVNAHVRGTFAIVFEGQPGVILDGPANFPGNPKNAGTCDDGLWVNPQGKRTSGSVDKPHPHCVGVGTSTVTVTLEPISVHWGFPGQSANEFLQFMKDREDGQVKKVGGGGPNEPNTHGDGIIVAYAVANGVRVGTLTIDLNQYDLNQTNLFADDCTLGGDLSYARCLNLVIAADYAPLSVGGVGTARTDQAGFLYWSSATDPFNY